MLTHKQVHNTNRRWKTNYGSEYGSDLPKLVKARQIGDSWKQGIHLLNPSQDEISEAFCQASKDLYPKIWIHTKRTFGVK